MTPGVVWVSPVAVAVAAVGGLDTNFNRFTAALLTWWDRAGQD